MDIEILKKNYNKVLDREKKAEEYINKATEEQLKTWLPEFQKIIVELSQMIKDFERLAGRAMTQDETLKGFWW